VTALAAASRHRIVRLNLSEQTDMMDLLGSDLPVTDSATASAGAFQWRHGPFLQAVVSGCWVLLDELNLAPQTVTLSPSRRHPQVHVIQVLEGLNAVLDHRATVYVPELGRTFPCHADFRVFACQNPVHEGGGRKSLPTSFLNRFTKVHWSQCRHVT
jgi:midasin